MNVSSYVTLQQLILSLSAKEKEAIKLRSGIKHNRNGPSSFIKLYELILKNPDGNEELIFNKWVRTHVNMVSRHSFENSKSLLKNFILETLRLMNVPGHENTVQQKLDYAEILIAKGLKEEAFRILNSIEQSEIEGNHNLYFVIINNKKLLLMPYVEHQDSVENIKTILNENSQRIMAAEIQNDIFSFNLEVGMIARRTTIVKSKDDRKKLTELLNLPAAKLDPADLNISSKIMLFKTLSWLYHIMNEMKEAYQYQLRLLEVIEIEEDKYLNHAPDQYLSEIAAMINVSIQVSDFDAAEKYLRKYETICKDLAITHIHNICVIKNYRICLLTAQGLLAAGNVHLEEQLHLLNSNPFQIQKGHFATFMFVVMKGFFVSGQYEKVVSCYSDLLLKETKEREDVLFSAEILYTLSLYHLQPLDMRYHMFKSTRVFESQAESLQRRLRSSDKDRPLEIQLSNCFRNLSTKPQFAEHIQILHKLIMHLNEIEVAGYIYSEQFCRMVDIKKWALKQIQFLDELEKKR